MAIRLQMHTSVQDLADSIRQFNNIDYLTLIEHILYIPATRLEHIAELPSPILEVFCRQYLKHSQERTQGHD